MSLLFISHVAYSDEVYQYTDAKGNTVIGNKPHAHAEKMNLPQLPVYAAPISASDLKASGYTDAQAWNKSQAKSNQYIGSSEQKRKQVLQEELVLEQQALKDATDLLDQSKNIKLGKEKNDQKQYQARIQLLQDAVNEHQKNIDLLNKQLH